MSQSIHLIKEFGQVLVNNIPVITSENDLPVVFANTEESISADTGSVTFKGGIGVLGNIVTGGSIISLGGIDMSNQRITNLGTPINPHDAVTLSFLETNSLSVTAGTGIVKENSIISVSPIQTHITSLGTISSGSWQANPIDVAYGGTGSTTFTNGQLLFGQGTSSIQTDSGLVYNNTTKSLVLSGINDSTSVSTGTMITSGGIAAGKSIYIGQNLTVDGQVNFKSTVDSTGINIGAVVVKGGIGVEKSLTIGGVANFAATVDSDSINSGGLVVVGGAGINKSLNVGGVAYFRSTIDSIGISSGGIIVKGGIGVAKSITIGEMLNVEGAVHFASQTESNGTSTGSVVIDGGVGINKSLNVGGFLEVQDLATFHGGITFSSDMEFSNVLMVTNETTSSSPTSGALVVEGGVGISENLNVGGSLIIHSTEDSMGLDSGSIMTLGGMAISKSLNVGQTAYFRSTMDSSSTQSGSIHVFGGITIDKSIIIGHKLNAEGEASFNGIVKITNQSESETPEDGSFIVDGGVGIKKTLNVGDEIHSYGSLIVDHASYFYEPIQQLSDPINPQDLTHKGYVDNLFNSQFVDLAAPWRFLNTSDAIDSTDGGSVSIDGGLAVAKKAIIGSDLYVDNGLINLASLSQIPETSQVQNGSMYYSPTRGCIKVYDEYARSFKPIKTLNYGSNLVFDDFETPNNNWLPVPWSDGNTTFEFTDGKAVLITSASYYSSFWYNRLALEKNIKIKVGIDGSPNRILIRGQDVTQFITVLIDNNRQLRIFGPGSGISGVNSPFLAISGLLPENLSNKNYIMHINTYNEHITSFIEDVDSKNVVASVMTKSSSYLDSILVGLGSLGTNSYNSFMTRKMNNMPKIICCGDGNVKGQDNLNGNSYNLLFEDRWTSLLQYEYRDSNVSVQNTSEMGETTLSLLTNLETRVMNWFVESNTSFCVILVGLEDAIQFIDNEDTNFSIEETTTRLSEIIETLKTNKWTVCVMTYPPVNLDAPKTTYLKDLNSFIRINTTGADLVIDLWAEFVDPTSDNSSKLGYLDQSFFSDAGSHVTNSIVCRQLNPLIMDSGSSTGAAGFETSLLENQIPVASADGSLIGSNNLLFSNNKLTINGLISTNTTDNNDDKALTLTGGGDDGNNRGGRIVLRGNEHVDGGGDVLLEAGATGSILFQINGVESKIDSTGFIGNWNGDVISVEKGGTGQTTFTPGQVLIGNGTSGITSHNNLNFTDNILTVAGTINVENLKAEYVAHFSPLLQDSFTTLSLNWYPYFPGYSTCDVDSGVMTISPTSSIDSFYTTWSNYKIHSKNISMNVDCVGVEQGVLAFRVQTNEDTYQVIFSKETTSEGKLQIRSVVDGSGHTVETPVPNIDTSLTYRVYAKSFESTLHAFVTNNEKVYSSVFKDIGSTTSTVNGLGCGSTEPQIYDNFDSYELPFLLNFVCLGDTTVAAEHLGGDLYPDGQPFPQLLQYACRDMPVIVTNSGMMHATAVDLNSNLETLVEPFYIEKATNICILFCGLYDTTELSLSPEVAFNNLSTLVNNVKAGGFEVWVCTYHDFTPEIPSASENYSVYRFNKRISEELNVKIVDLYSLLRNPTNPLAYNSEYFEVSTDNSPLWNEYFYSDFLYISPLGSETIANYLTKLVRKKVDQLYYLGQPALFNDSYTKTESDSKYLQIGDSYTKTESDSKYRQIDDSYTKTESDSKYLQIEPKTLKLVNPDVINNGGSITFSSDTNKYGIFGIGDPRNSYASGWMSSFSGGGYRWYGGTGNTDFSSQTKIMEISQTGNLDIVSGTLNVGGGGRLRIAKDDTDYTLIGTRNVDGDSNTRIVISGNNRDSGAGSIEYIATTGTSQHEFFVDKSGVKTKILALKSGSEPSIVIAGNTESTSPTSGILTCQGGVGISGNTYVGGIIRCKNTAQTTSTDTGSCVFEGGIGIAKNMYVGGSVRFKSTEDSGSTSTGSCIIEGGLAVAQTASVKALRIGSWRIREDEFGQLEFFNTTTNKSIVFAPDTNIGSTYFALNQGGGNGYFVDNI